MKKSMKIFVLMTSLALLFASVGGFSYALSDNSFYIPNAVSRISVAVERTSSDKVVASISGSATSIASSITMTATLYEYKSGKLTKVSGSSVTKEAKNCTSYNFDTSFRLSPDKSYKVTAVVTDVTNGVSTTITKTSSVF